MNKARMIMANMLLLVFIMGIVVLPSVSSGMMRVNKNDTVLGVTDTRLPENTPTTFKRPTTNNVKVKTIIIQEINPNKVTQDEKPVINTPEIQEVLESTQTTESTTPKIIMN